MRLIGGVPSVALGGSPVDADGRLATKSVNCEGVRPWIQASDTGRMLRMGWLRVSLASPSSSW